MAKINPLAPAVRRASLTGVPASSEHHADASPSSKKHSQENNQKMIVVADKLSEIALEERVPDNVDLFGRSAFNRYYYASYLITRDMLGQCNPDWAKTSHKDIPILLKNGVQKKIKEAIWHQKGKLITHRDGKQMAQQATAAIIPLAQLLASAYEVRCVADYEPGERIQAAQQSFELIGHTNHEANAWPRRTSAYSKTILKIWKHLGLS